MRDERVEAAIQNWAPRFVANGIDINEFHRITGALERWEDWCDAWSEAGDAHRELAVAAERDGFHVSAAEHHLRASMCYHFGKFLFVEYPEALRCAHDRTVSEYLAGLPGYDFPGERVAIPASDGAVMYGIFRKPWHVVKPPVVILIPGLDSVKEELHGYGNDCLRRGMAVLAIDGPGQGEMEFTHPMRHDYEVPVGWAIDWLAARPDIDASRIGLLGVSLGGYYAVRAAAFEPRVAAAVSVSGDYCFAENFHRLPSLTRAAFVHRSGSRDEAEALAKLARFDLGEAMPHLRVPLLVIVGALDRLVPPSAGERIAREAGTHGTLWYFADGNHVCNNIPYKYRPQAADWLARQLGGSQKTSAGGGAP
jgi:dienelactone hydrolase